MSEWRQSWVPCRPWNNVRPDRHECIRCQYDKCLKRERNSEHQRREWWI